MQLAEAHCTEGCCGARVRAVAARLAVGLSAPTGPMAAANAYRQAEQALYVARRPAAGLPVAVGAVKPYGRAVSSSARRSASTSRCWNVAPSSATCFQRRTPSAPIRNTARRTPIPGAATP